MLSNLYVEYFERDLLPSVVDFETVCCSFVDVVTIITVVVFFY